MNAIVYCTYREYYWHATCAGALSAAYESQKQTHGSARQAADEVLEQLRLDLGNGVTMRRLTPKTYEITVPSVLRFHIWRPQ